MKVILFWVSGVTTQVYDTAQAVSWDNPGEWILPLQFKPDKDQRAWLEYYRNPVFSPWMNAEQNIIELARQLKTWPLPYESDQFQLLLDAPDPNDDINF